MRVAILNRSKNEVCTWFSRVYTKVLYCVDPPSNLILDTYTIHHASTYQSDIL